MHGEVYFIRLIEQKAILFYNKIYFIYFKYFILNVIYFTLLYFNSSLQQFKNLKKKNWKFEA